MYKRLNQKQLIHSLSQKELYVNLYFTQAIFLIITIIVSIVTGQSYIQWKDLFVFDGSSILKWSIPIVLGVVIIDLLLWKCAPKHWIDDGGINERIFSDLSFLHLIFLTAVIGITEELLFRGALQVNIGYIPASLLFAFMHIRYITKPLLLLLATLLSFFLGGIFLITGNLLIPIIIHFLIDFLLGFILRYDLFAVRNQAGYKYSGVIYEDGEKGE